MLKYARANVPRYTSYPTAPHFAEDFDKQTYQDWLAELTPDDPLSLYFHIPFCAQLCWYCGCHTSVPNNYSRAERYTRSIIREIILVTEEMSSPGPVSHVHFGGGTPTYLQDTELRDIFLTIRNRLDFANDAEIAVEIDPRTLTRSMVETLSEIGITRASLGVQDFAPHVQKAINREQSFEMIAEKMSWLRAAGINAINFDLMYGLPLQTVEDVQQSARLATDLNPDRIAVFGYAHVPWFKKNQLAIDEKDLPGLEERYDQAMQYGLTLGNHGYNQIGFDHYALAHDPMSHAWKAGTLHRNFQGFTTDTATTLIGFGASSIGQFPGGFVQNLKDLRHYNEAAEASHLPVERGRILSNEDKLFGAAIEAIMCRETVNLELIAHTYDNQKSIFDACLKRLAPLEEDGLVEISNYVLRITKSGARFTRNIAAQFDQYFQKAAARHSKAI